MSIKTKPQTNISKRHWNFELNEASENEGKLGYSWRVNTFTYGICHVFGGLGLVLAKIGGSFDQ